VELVGSFGEFVVGLLVGSEGVSFLEVHKEMTPSCGFVR